MSVVIAEEGIFTAIAPLGEMMRDSRDQYSSYARHLMILRPSSQGRKINRVASPHFPKEFSSNAGTTLDGGSSLFLALGFQLLPYLLQVQGCFFITGFEALKLPVAGCIEELDRPATHLELEALKGYPEAVRSGARLIRDFGKTQQQITTATGSKQTVRVLNFESMHLFHFLSGFYHLPIRVAHEPKRGIYRVIDEVDMLAISELLLHSQRLSVLAMESHGVGSD